MSYLPNHQQEGAPTTPRHPSGLFSALDKVGRVRGSSATPPPPIPAKNPERAQIEQELLQRLRDMPSHEDYSMNTGKLPAGVLCSLHTRNSSDETEVSEGGGVLISTQKPPSVNELAIEFQGRLNGLIDRIRSTNIPSLAQTLLINEVQSIGKDFRDREKRLKEEIDHITSERNNLANRLREIARQLRIATAERDKNRNDYQDLFLGMEDLKTKAKKSEAALAEAKGQFAQEIEQLNMKLKHQDEQLKGKRALWLNSNPGSSARRSAMTAIRDPFESPSAPSASFNSINTSFGSGNMGNILSPKSTTPYTSFDSQTSSGSAPPKMNMRAASTPQKLRSRGPIHGGTPSGMPSGGTLSERMRKSHLRGPSQNIRNPLFTAGYGDTPTNPNYDPNFKPSLASLDISGRALELYVEEGGSDLAPEFREVLGHLYIVIEGWAREYANIPQPENDQEVIKNNPDAWEFIMNCTYPAKRQDAHVHAVALMNDRTSRFWFIMRIMCQHIFLNMVTMKGWYGFSEECDAKLDVLRKKFSERGLQNEARQKLVDQRVAVIKEIMDGINFQDWRSEQLNHHTQVLRTIVSQFLNYDCDRLVAGRDLGLLTIEAWEVSTKMNATPVSFQVLFPETNGKFSSTSMMAKDRQDVDSMELQLRQTRLKLVITPVITLRDDRGTTMKAKSLLLSTVLCMQ